MEPTDQDVAPGLDAPTAVAASTGRRPSARPPLLCLVAADLVVVIGSFLPWVISGSAQRDSYATIRVAKNVGVVGMTLWETLLSIWYVTPLLAAVVVVGVLLHRPPLARLAAIPLGAIALALAALVRFAPVDHGIGPVVTLLGSVGLLTAAGWSFRADRRLRTREPTPGLVPNA